VWVINHKDTKLWQGVGIAPGPAVNIYSGRAEAFGLITGLTFLRLYVASYKPTQFHTSPLYCFCNNLGVVTNVNELLSSTVKQPNDTTNDDWDVYMAISTLAQACHPLLLQFFHVKGHQDSDPRRQLTRTKKLNVDCNKWAKDYTNTTTIISTSLANPAMPEAQPHLRINSKIICRKLPMALRHAATIQPYRMYLQQKFNWTDGDAATIHWEILNMTLASYCQEDQWCLILFINQKLPLWASKMHPHHGSSLCPSCQREQEDRGHFLQCTHPERTKLFHAMHRTLTEKSQKLNLHPCIFMTIWLGLIATRTNIPYPDVLQEVLPPVRLPVCFQQWLGWSQCYYGRISSTWATTINAVHPMHKYNGEQVMTALMKIIWQYVLNTWALQNHHLHHNATQLNLLDFKQAAWTLYEQHDQLTPNAQEALYRQPLEQILELPAPCLEHWVIYGHKYFNQQKKAAKQQARLHTADIRTFFQAPTLQGDDLQPP